MAYRIKTVADMVGVPRNTLIAWERRLGIGDPGRSDSGYRLYTDEDVHLLRRVKTLVDQGLKIGEAWSIVQKERERPPRPVSSAPESLDGLREEVELALLDFDRESADRAAARLLMVPIERQLDEVLFPMLHSVGDAWAAGELSVPQEHYVSGWARERMMLLMNTVPPPAPGALEVTCATPSGEQHELGLLGVALKLQLRRFRVTWLGANVPLADLVEHARQRSPYAVCVSLVQGRSPADLAAYARDLRRRIPPATRIALGGPGTVLPELPAIPGVVWCGDQLPAWADEGAMRDLSAR